MQHEFHDLRYIEVEGYTRFTVQAETSVCCVTQMCSQLVLWAMGCEDASARL